jgi:hypothetical protein
METNRLASGEDRGKEQPGVIGQQDDHRMQGWFFQCLEEGIRHIGGHPIRSRQDTDATSTFIGSVCEISLHLSHLVNLQGLAFWLKDQDIGVKMMIDLFTRETPIASLPFFKNSFEAVEGLCKLESRQFFPNSFIA